MSTASEKANLARIRDNQRRSRARRKEYLQELEARLRQTELQGIEASAEIQTAARRVAEENRKLRGMLAQHGFGDDSVDTYLQTSPNADSIISGQSGNTSAAVQVLEQLLQARKPFFNELNGASVNSGAGSAGSRDRSVSQTTVQSQWEPMQSQRQSVQPTGKMTSSQHQYISSGSSNQGSSATLGRDSRRSISRLQQPTTIPRNLSPISLHTNQTPQIYDFDSDISHPNPYDEQSVNGHHHTRLQSISDGSSRYDPSQNSNVNSNIRCDFATDMITTMVGGDPSEVRANLGCYPGVECEVDNQLVFDVMDRYN